jgi:hypothetical protein
VVGLEQAREHAWFHYAAPELRRSTPLQTFVIPAPWQEVGEICSPCQVTATCLKVDIYH